jgi:hypothetical protein
MEINLLIIAILILSVIYTLFKNEYFESNSTSNNISDSRSYGGLGLGGLISCIMFGVSSLSSLMYFVSSKNNKVHAGN